MISHLSSQAWVLLVIGAAVVGFAKTAVGGAGALAVVAFAAALPSKESTGALLPVLCVGDLIAVRVYHRHADWGVLLRLLPGVLPGLVAGTLFLAVTDDTVMRRSIGVILMVMALVQLVMWRRGSLWQTQQASPRMRTLVALGMGGLAGFTTMTANAAGPVTTLYLLMAGLPVLSFLGTAAWFFLVVNLCKLPFSAGLSLISVDSLYVDALLVLPLAAGALAGVILVRRIDQRQFERAALGLALIASIALIA